MRSPGHPSGPCRGALLFGSSIEIDVATYEETNADSSASGGEDDGGISQVERAGPRPICWGTTEDPLRPYRRRNQKAMSKLPFRPEGHEGSVEQYLPKVQNAIVKALTQAQKGLSHDTLRLDRPYLKALAAILVEFVEDLHCEIGIWRSLERYNTEFFGTLLPFLFEPKTALPLDAISPTRLQHFLWILYPQLIPDLLLRPDHTDLVRLAQVAAEVLQEQFADLPKDSGVKHFLGTPHKHGWEVKRKLVWLGTGSYLFRIFCQRYIEEQNAEFSDIGVVDDFLCQQCTEWAGLGAIEVLASVLDLPPERRADLLSWSERHNAVFKVLSGNKEKIEVLNLINDVQYRVRLDLERNPVARGDFVFGSLVPWDGEWYWSGEQKRFDRLDAAEIEQVKQNYREQPTIYYRYSPEDLKKAREMVCQQYEEFVASHGKDWVVYPDGLMMAADWQKSAKAKIAALPEDERNRRVEKHGLKALSPEMNIPRDLLESKNGIGVYFNPNEGMEIMPDFNDILSGLKKKGRGLTGGEEVAIREWVTSQSLSPGFVRRLAEEHGSGSIAAAFLLEKQKEDYVLEYLLRRYKGRFYRPRYPTLTILK